MTLGVQGPPNQPPPPGAWARPPAPPQAPPPPSANGWAIAALVLGLVTLGLSPLPVLNQGGILAGLVGIGIGITAVIVGLRRGSRIVMASVGLGLSVLGVVLSFVFTEMYVRELDRAFTDAGLPNVSESYVAGPRTFTLEVTSTGLDSLSSVNWTNSTGGMDSERDRTSPWRQTVTISDGAGAMVSGGGWVDSGSAELTCTIREGDRVVDTQTVRGQYVNVNCDTY
ncbi:hypothetical protein [Actinomycetospora flava]|uniref:MmpS family membrane protein n=1 Tax=Actinomycetospora flava TaxID=3129232 RepID=A0ABU8MBE7_9PSEU